MDLFTFNVPPNYLNLLPFSYNARIPDVCNQYSVHWAEYRSNRRHCWSPRLLHLLERFSQCSSICCFGNQRAWQDMHVRKMLNVLTLHVTVWLTLTNLNQSQTKSRIFTADVQITLTSDLNHLNIEIDIILDREQKVEVYLIV